MSSSLSRRSVLGLGMTGLAALASPQGLRGPAASRRKRAKNVIFMVSDGMSMGVPSLASQYREIVAGKTGVWLDLLQRDDVVAGVMDTRSLNSLVTDSAAAASSWGSGRLNWNGQLNCLPDGTELTPLGVLMRAAGAKVGLVTTATITHATPAGFGVSHKTRNEEDVIATKYLANGIDLLMGGGNRFFAADKRKDKVDLYAKYREAGYAVAQTKAEMDAMAGQPKQLGVFSEGHIPYEVDRVNSAELLAKVPSLADMTQQALRSLAGSPKGFLLQVEGGRIDHAAHSNDFAAIIHDQLAFEEAVRVAMEFAERDGDTLVVVTSDHGNSNPGMTGAAEYGEGNGVATVALAKASFEGMRSELTAAKTPSDIGDLIRVKLGIDLTAEEAGLLAGASPLKPFRAYAGGTQTLAMVLGNHTGIGWSSASHTSDWTLVTAFGPGSAPFGGYVRNTSCFDAVLAAKGLRHTNPSMTLDEARRFGLGDDMHWGEWA